MRRDVPKSAVALVTERTILKPLWVCSSIYFLQNSIDSGDRLEEWGSFPMS